MKALVTGEVVVQLDGHNIIVTITEHTVILRDEDRVLVGPKRERYFRLWNALSNKFHDVLDSLDNLTRG